MKHVLPIFFVLISAFGFSQWQPLTFSVTGGDCDELTGASELFISEVYDHSGGSFAGLELYNPTNAPILLSNYSLRRTSDYGDGNWVAAWDAVTAAMVGRSIPANSTFLIYLGTSSFGCSQTPDISNTDSFTGLNANDQIQLLKGGVVIDDWRGPSYNFYSMVRRPAAEVPKALFNNADWITSGPNCSNLDSHTINPTTPPEIDNISRYRDNPGTIPYTYCATPTRVRVQMDSMGGTYTYSYNLQGVTSGINLNGTTGIFSNLPEDVYNLTVTVRKNGLILCTIIAQFNITGGTETSPIILLNP